MKRGDYAKFHGKLVKILNFRYSYSSPVKKMAMVNYVKDKKPKVKFKVEVAQLEPLFNQTVPRTLYGK